MRPAKLSYLAPTSLPHRQIIILYRGRRKREISGCLRIDGTSMICIMNSSKRWVMQRRSQALSPQTTISVPCRYVQVSSPQESLVGLVIIPLGYRHQCKSTGNEWVRVQSLMNSGERDGAGEEECRGDAAWFALRRNRVNARGFQFFIIILTIRPIRSIVRGGDRGGSGKPECYSYALMCEFQRQKNSIERRLSSHTHVHIIYDPLGFLLDVPVLIHNNTMHIQTSLRISTAER